MLPSPLTHSMTDMLSSTCIGSSPWDPGCTFPCWLRNHQLDTVARLPAPVQAFPQPPSSPWLAWPLLRFCLPLGFSLGFSLGLLLGSWLLWLQGNVAQSQIQHILDRFGSFLQSLWWWQPHKLGGLRRFLSINFPLRLLALLILDIWFLRCFSSNLPKDIWERWQARILTTLALFQVVWLKNNHAQVSRCWVSVNLTDQAILPPTNIFTQDELLTELNFGQKDIKNCLILFAKWPEDIGLDLGTCPEFPQHRHKNSNCKIIFVQLIL